LLLSLANTNKQTRNARRQAKALTQKELLKTELSTDEIYHVYFFSLSLSLSRSIFFAFEFSNTNKQKRMQKDK
jgi:hypothetical protein